MPKMTLPKKLLPLIQKKKRFKIIIGGRGSGKSMSVADICLMDAQTQGIKTACFREFQNSIDDSVIALLTDEVERLGLVGFDCQNTKILLDDIEAFKFRGLARNPEGIKSMHGFKRFWVEEAQTISAKSLKALTPTLRTEDSEIWMTANPKSSADPFSQRFIVPYQKQLIKHGYYEDDLHLIIVCNYQDNPFFPAVLEQERAHDEKHLGTAEYRHIWEGAFNDEVAGSIISVDWFNAAIDAHEKLGFKPVGAKIATFDPSDEGGDAKGYALRHGSVILDVCDNETGDANDGCDWATEKAIEAGADYFGWDCDGLGISLKRQVNQAIEGKKIESFMFKGSEAADNPEQIYNDIGNEKRSKSKTNKQTFKNKRAQYYWRLRDRFYATYRAVVKGEYIDPEQLISLSSNIKDIDSLRAEVCRIPKKPNANGMIQIMSKQDMLKMNIPSPNCFAKGTMVDVAGGRKPIEDIRVGDMIYTPMGFAEVTHTHCNDANDIALLSLSNGIKIESTPDHNVFTWNKGWVPVSSLTANDRLETNNPLRRVLWLCTRLLFTKNKSSTFKHQVNIICQEGRLTRRGFFTEESGAITMGRYLKDAISTIKTTTDTIMNYLTLSVSMEPCTDQCICGKEWKTQRPRKKLLIRYCTQEKRRLYGIDQKKEGSGTEPMQKGQYLGQGLWSSFARIVKKAMLRTITGITGFVETNAIKSGDTKTSGKTGFVSHVARRIIAHRPVKVKHVHTHAQRRPVYNLTLKEHNVFYANGILVSNCADSVMMAMYIPEVMQDNVNINFESLW